jgi:hypothetical protein
VAFLVQRDAGSEAEAQFLESLVRRELIVLLGAWRTAAFENDGEPDAATWTPNSKAATGKPDDEDADADDVSAETLSPAELRDDLLTGRVRVPMESGPGA